MLFWIVFSLAVLGVILLIKFSKIGLAFTLGFLAILILSFIKVVSINSVELSSPTGIFLAPKLYFSWLANVFDNVKVITGNIIKMNWFPSN